MVSAESSGELSLHAHIEAMRIKETMGGSAGQRRAVLVTTGLKGERDKSTFLVGDFNNSLLAIHRITEQKNILTILGSWYFPCKF